ncbi:N-acetylneuraminate synthase [Bdellovibrio bacteriovorus]|uniref:N-acetylneuraminate synthase n=1 Tax=Bdellovibrio bacteriovorus TaxID=959 RepID=UPI0035A5E1E5
MNNETLIIAEAGVNHNGDLATALKLVDVAVDAGADIVKFQTFKAKNLVTESAVMAEYQKRNLGEEQSQLNMLKKLELSYDDHYVLIEHCRKRNIRFLSTAFDFESLAFLETLKMGQWKVPSGEITNLPYLEIIGRRGEPVIVSTGMADFDEVQAAIKVLTGVGLPLEKITVLHCNTDYPTQMSDVNLRAMKTLGERLNVSFGYSDHTMGIEVPIAATALGAKVIEKHFTLDRNAAGPDHKASLEPAELKAMVEAIRNINQALGRSEKRPTDSELKNRAVARKSLVAKKAIKAGEVFTSENLTTRRPGSGVSPMRWYEFIGQKSSRDYQENELIHD